MKTRSTFYTIGVVLTCLIFSAILCLLAVNTVGVLVTAQKTHQIDETVLAILSRLKKIEHDANTYTAIPVAPLPEETKKDTSDLVEDINKAHAELAKERGENYTTPPEGPDGEFDIEAHEKKLDESLKQLKEELEKEELEKVKLLAPRLEV